jgi:hypothetical protein
MIVWPPYFYIFTLLYTKRIFPTDVRQHYQTYAGGVGLPESKMVPNVRSDRHTTAMNAVLTQRRHDRHECRFNPKKAW